MPRKKADARENSVSLHIASSFSSAWHEVVLPWFKTGALKALQDSEPVGVITPSRSLADVLRRNLLAERVSLLGIQFLTPPQLRELLVRGYELVLPLREHLRLLLSLAAEDFIREFKDDRRRASDLLIANSIAREPDNFLRAIDQFRATGSDLRGIDPAILREIATRYEARVHDCGFALVYEADRFLLKHAEKEEPAFGRLLVIGFDGAHWPLWPLLNVAVRRSRDTAVLLNDRRDEARDLDEAWIGTWEEHFGAAQSVSTSDDSPVAFADLTQPLDSPGAVGARKENPHPNIRFLMARDTSEQARAVASLAAAFLSNARSETVGVLLPGPGALARLIAQSLENLGIAHNDSIAHSMRGPFDDEEWRSWLELQSRPRLGSLLRFLNHSSAAIEFFANLELRVLEKELRNACGDILINDIAVLTEYCSRRTDHKKLPTIATGLRRVRLLPSNASFVEFLKATSSIFRELNWRERAIELGRMTDNWNGSVSGDFSRDHFVRWLTDVFAESALCREPAGDNPYARVQLLRYDQADNQSWSHLILAGLNEGVWPRRDDESPFLPDEQIAALNARLRELNRRITREGRFGAGHATLDENSTLCVGARERREIALRQLLNAVESSNAQLAVSAQLYNSSPREQAVNPSEFYARLYFNARGRALSQREIDSIHQQTREWLGETKLFESITPPETDLGQTETAYRIRRTSGGRFSEYEFAFREGAPPQRAFSISATDAARLFTAPALVWMKTFLRLEADDLDTTSWNLATGQWVHRWLAVVGKPQENKFVSPPPAEQIVQRVTTEADRFHDDVTSILQSCNRALPDWWVSGWRNARYLSNRFAKELTRIADWPHLATEWMLDSPQTIPLENGDELRVRGRVDLLLATGEPSEGQLWIVDYKTGIAAPLKSHPTALRKQLLAGNGVQICIYALALRALGWRQIGASLLTRENELDGPDVTISAIDGQKQIWREIARMEKTGIFGMLGELRSEFTFIGKYPLATLSMDKDLLREKWRRTHPAFAGGETIE